MIFACDFELEYDIIRLLMWYVLVIGNPKHACDLCIREKVMSVVVKAMKNPRSALIKTSIMASSDIVYAFGDQLLDSTSDAFDSLVRTISSLLCFSPFF